jgi:hypothetical protein
MTVGEDGPRPPLIRSTQEQLFFDHIRYRKNHPPDKTVAESAAGVDDRA